MSWNYHVIKFKDDTQKPENRCNSCYKNMCKHNSTCIPKPSRLNPKQEYECSCLSGFYGEKCEQTKDNELSCYGEPCKNGGYCKATNSNVEKYVCECTNGWEG
jgi:hypothetical protein